MFFGSAFFDPSYSFPTHIFLHLIYPYSHISSPARLCTAINLVEEYWVSGGQVPDAVANLEDMRKAGASMPAAVVAVVVAALDHRGTDVAARLPPFVDVLVAATQGSALSPSDLALGALSLAKSLHGLTEDMPKVRPKGLWLFIFPQDGRRGRSSGTSHCKNALALTGDSLPDFIFFRRPPISSASSTPGWSPAAPFPSRRSCRRSSASPPSRRTRTRL